MIRFDVPGVPISQPRQRVGTIAGKAQAYLPSKHPVNDYKATIRLAAAGLTVLDGPICLSVLFVMPRPKSKIWKTRDMPSYPHAKKPDLDNLIKAVLDALSGVAWRDDAQVCYLNASKKVAAGSVQPRTEICIWSEDG